MTRTVDFHAHFLPQSIIEAASSGASWYGSEVHRNEGGFPVIVSGGRPRTMGSIAYLDDPAQRVEKMTAIGVDTQVLSVAPVLFRYQNERDAAIAAARDINDEIAGMIERWPDRFLGYATLPLQAPDAAIEELGRAVNELGLVGASVGTHVDGDNWDAPHLVSVLEAAEALGALVFFHPTDQRITGTVSGYHLGNMIGNPFETTVAVGSLIFGGVLDRIPDAKLLFAHAGGFSYANIGRFDHGYRVRDDAKTQANALPSEYMSRFYFDCLSHHGLSLRHLMDAVGSDHVVLGTDYPADMGLAEPVGWLESCGHITDAEREMILGRNAETLLGIGSPESAASLPAPDGAR